MIVKKVDDNMVAVLLSIANYIETMHEGIMPASAEAAARLIMERVEQTYLLLPRKTTVIAAELIALTTGDNG